MKKTKRFVLTTAIVASLSLGAATTAVSPQTSQAAGLSDILSSLTSGDTSSLSSLISGTTNSLDGSTTTGVNVSNLGDTITLVGGTEPTEENIKAAIGGDPTFLGLIPANIKVSDDGTEVTFTPDLNIDLGSFGDAINKLIGTSKTVKIAYSSAITFQGGQTSTNVKKGDKTFDLNSSNTYKITPEANLTGVDVVDNGQFNYAYPGSYTVVVQPQYSDGTKSEETSLTVNVLDAQWSNTDQTILKGQQVDTSAITATDTIGNTLDITADTSDVNTSKVGDYKVTYTGTDKALGWNGEPMTWTKTGTVHVVNSDSSQTISFQDANSGDVIDTTTITGADGQSKTVTPPAGYELVNDADSSITLQKGAHSSTVQVVKEGSSVATPFTGTVATYANGGVVPLYSSGGTQTTRSLAPNSDWATDQTKTIDGETFYRVSTNEWVKASQVYAYNGTSATITTNSGSIKALYTTDGNKSTRSLAPNTAWYTDRTATINGASMYRVSTNEWINSTDVH
ncbi:SLAP domain-containing protein [Companilactobacillus furfuricola]|uniref:SLAP domain-containing protein n=1 Tax=Companilactobacillus furfuricola TaxID=1462575 RepID=UPI000F77205D|nr:SLAP domain-containing protein [Companilactobacillus furfuricola]